MVFRGGRFDCEVRAVILLGLPHNATNKKALYTLHEYDYLQYKKWFGTAGKLDAGMLPYVTAVIKADSSTEIIAYWSQQVSLLPVTFVFWQSRPRVLFK